MVYGKKYLLNIKCYKGDIMAGGDSFVTANNGQVGRFADPSSIEVIDANSVKAGNMTEPRDINGKTMFFTKDGSDAIDKWKITHNTAGGSFEAKSDPGFMDKLLWNVSFGYADGNIPIKQENHVGDPKAK